MKHEIIIELERVTIIEKHKLNHDSNNDEDNDVIEVEARVIKENIPDYPKKVRRKKINYKFLMDNWSCK
jgi:hypothetical protein